jgi:hypothetical protein
VIPLALKKYLVLILIGGACLLSRRFKRKPPQT